VARVKVQEVVTGENEEMIVMNVMIAVMTGEVEEIEEAVAIGEAEVAEIEEINMRISQCADLPAGRFAN
jgi:hypothetical protein